MSVSKFFTIVIAVWLSFNSSSLTGNTRNGDQPFAEKAWVQTDRNIFIAGETLLFKVYVVNQGDRKLSNLSKLIYLVLRNNLSQPISTLQLKIDDGTGNGSIFLPDTLSSGIYQLVVFTNWMKNAGEETFFHKEIIIANRFDNDLFVLDKLVDGKKQIDQIDEFRNGVNVGNFPLVITTEKKEFSTRERIKMELKFQDTNLHKLADLSVSVIEAEPDEMITPNAIPHYLYSSGKTDHRINTNDKKFHFLPETKNDILQGNVIDPLTKKGLMDVRVFLSSPDTFVNLQYDNTDQEGLFRFSLNGYYNGKEVIVSANGCSLRTGQLILENKFELNNPVNAVHFSESADIKSYIGRSQQIVNIQKNYNRVSFPELKDSLKQNYKCSRIYNKPYYVVYPADFVPFVNLNEMSYEILPMLRIRKMNSRFVATMGDDNQHQFMEHQPAIFLDGVLIDDINQIIQLGSDKIYKLEFINTRYNYGTLVFPGIMAVFTKNEAIKTIQPFPVSLRVKQPFIQRYSDFDVNTSNSVVLRHQPDFRQVLYWNPKVILAGSNALNLEFNTSDHAGTFMVIAEGITSDGTPFRVISKFKVK